jgi:hypothetical protein
MWVQYFTPSIENYKKYTAEFSLRFVKKRSIAFVVFWKL